MGGWALKAAVASSHGSSFASYARASCNSVLDATFSPSPNLVTPNKLDASFCGLNRPDMVALWAMVDDPSNATATEPDGLVDATNWALGAVPGDVLGVNILDAMTPALFSNLQSALTNSSFNEFAALQHDILSPSVPRSAIGRAAVIPDGSGGFAVPIRNRLSVNGGSVSGYSTMFCSVFVAQPYTPLVAYGMFPVYTNADAAAADTQTFNGVTPPPLAVPGYVLNPAEGDALLYFFPSVPASTAGMICGSVGVLGPYVPTDAIGGFKMLDPSSPECTAFLQRMKGAATGRRRLLASQSPLSFSTFRTSAPQPPTVVSGAAVFLEAAPPASAVGSPASPAGTPGGAAAPASQQGGSAPSGQPSAASPTQPAEIRTQHMPASPPPAAGGSAETAVTAAESLPPPAPLGSGHASTAGAPAPTPHGRTIPPPPPGPADGGLSSRAIAGIIVAAVVAVASMAACVLWAVSRRRTREKQQHTRGLMAAPTSVGAGRQLRL